MSQCRFLTSRCIPSVCVNHTGPVRVPEAGVVGSGFLSMTHHWDAIPQKATEEEWTFNSSLLSLFFISILEQKNIAWILLTEKLPAEEAAEASTALRSRSPAALPSTQKQIAPPTGPASPAQLMEKRRHQEQHFIWAMTCFYQIRLNKHLNVFQWWEMEMETSLLLCKACVLWATPWDLVSPSLTTTLLATGQFYQHNTKATEEKTLQEPIF